MQYNLLVENAWRTTTSGEYMENTLVKTTFTGYKEQIF